MEPTEAVTSLSLFLSLTHTHTHIYIYIYTCVCVCACVCVRVHIPGLSTTGRMRRKVNLKRSKTGLKFNDTLLLDWLGNQGYRTRSAIVFSHSREKKR